MGRPTVSVLMNCLNGARYLREALNSVFAQTYTDWEIIFWDDASTDESATIVLYFLEREYPDCRLRYFRGPGGQTLGASRNMALNEARGKYLAILDCDDVWDVQKLASQIESMEKYPEIAFSYSNCFFMDETGYLIDLAFRRTPPPANMYEGLLTQPNFMLCPTLVFRMDAVTSVGGFDRTLAYAETYDLCVRLAKNYKAAYSRNCLAYHRRHAQQANGTGRARTYREVLQVMNEHRNWRSWSQIKREGLLWTKYLWKRYAYS